MIPLSDLNDYAKTYRATRDTYLKQANACASPSVILHFTAHSAIRMFHLVHLVVDDHTSNLWTLTLFFRLKLATGPYKAARDAYVAATATYTKSLYE